jgi:hypothetical protein
METSNAPRLRADALGFAESVVMGVAGTGPAYSVAASTAALVGAVGVHAPASLLYCGLIMFGPLKCAKVRPDNEHPRRRLHRDRYRALFVGPVGDPPATPDHRLAFRREPPRCVLIENVVRPTNSTTSGRPVASGAEGTFNQQQTLARAAEHQGARKQNPDAGRRAFFGYQSDMENDRSRMASVVFHKILLFCANFGCGDRI